MIRRTIQTPDGQQAWILVQQQEHARLSATLSGWIAAMPLAADDVAQVEWAILHHDDGWQEWDDSPGLDAHGQPIAFDEMAVEDANGIWSESIRAATARGDLAGYLVARHFLLLRAASSAAQDPASQAFVQDYQRIADGCLERWVAAQPERRQALLTAEDALERLRWADLLSLWLCGDLPPQPVLIPGPGGIEQELSVVGTERLGLVEPLTYCLDPWPPMPLKREYSLQASQVPLGSYSNAQELKQVAKPVTIFGVLGRWDTWQ